MYLLRRRACRSHKKCPSQLLRYCLLSWYPSQARTVLSLGRITTPWSLDRDDPLKRVSNKICFLTLSSAVISTQRLSPGDTSSGSEISRCSYPHLPPRTQVHETSDPENTRSGFQRNKQVADRVHFQRVNKTRMVSAKVRFQLRRKEVTGGKGRAGSRRRCVFETGDGTSGPLTDATAPARTVTRSTKGFEPFVIRAHRRQSRAS